MRLSVSILSLLVLCYVSGITESAAIAKRNQLTPRASFCQDVFGVDVCVAAEVNGLSLYLKFTINGVTIIDNVIDPLANPEFCHAFLGVNVCLYAKVEGTNVCFSAKGSVPLIGTQTFNLGCLYVGNILGKK